MDRALTLDERRSLSLRRAAPWLAAALLVGAGYGAFRWVLTPTVARADLRTGTVDLGPVEATIQVTGTVVPVLETVVTSPTAARVVRVAHPAGDTVAAGATVVALDLAADADALRRLDDQVAIKRNAGTQERLTLDARLIGLGNDLRARRLDLEQAEALLAQQEGLRTRGLATEPDVRAARVVVEKARLDVERLGAETRNARALTAARLDGLALDARVLATDRAQAARRLREAQAQVLRPGVVTWTVPQEGVVVAAGEPIARVADLTAFRVEASVPDLYAAQVRAGQAARVQVGDTVLDATVSAVRPSVQNGALTVLLTLARPAHPLLRPSLRADVFVVTEARPRALRLPRGPALAGPGRQRVFVVRGDRAEAAEVTLGLASFDRQEVVAGLAEGDVVVLSDTRAYAGRRALRLR